jgi:hypothetical protein
MKVLLTSLFAAACLGFSSLAFAADDATAPKTLIHVVTVTWKADAKPEQIQAALDGAKKLPAAFKGITRVWTRTVKAQGERTHGIVMEFADEAALKAYAGSAAQKEWYKVYEPVRERSTTFDISN